MHKNLFGLLLCGAAAFPPLQAAILEFDLRGRAGSGLLPANEVPTQLSTAATGMAQGPITYDTATRELAFDISFSNLNDAPAAAWLRGPADLLNVNAVLYPLDAYLQLTGPTSGSLTSPSPSGPPPTGTLTLIENPNGITYSIAQQETDLTAGLWYIEIASQGTYSMGEIRGNLIVVPEPAAYATLAGLALAGVAISRRARQTKRLSRS